VKCLVKNNFLFVMLLILLFAFSNFFFNPFKPNFWNPFKQNFS